jgi:hypothetical protein
MSEEDCGPFPPDLLNLVEGSAAGFGQQRPCEEPREDAYEAEDIESV